MQNCTKPFSQDSKPQYTGSQWVTELIDYFSQAHSSVKYSFYTESQLNKVYTRQKQRIYWTMLLSTIWISHIDHQQV